MSEQTFYRWKKKYGGMEVGDARRLQQVLLNLLGNAVKFTLQGEVLLRVVGTPEDGRRTTLQITVEDTGIGIAPEKVEHVFGEFNQVEDERNRQFEGTGLGLAITKRLIEMMQGAQGKGRHSVSAAPTHIDATLVERDSTGPVPG